MQYFIVINYLNIFSSHCKLRFGVAVNIIHSLYYFFEKKNTSVYTCKNDQRVREIILLLVKDMFLLIPQRALVSWSSRSKLRNYSRIEHRLSFDLIRYVYLLAAGVIAFLFRNARISKWYAHIVMATRSSVEISTRILRIFNDCFKNYSYQHQLILSISRLKIDIYNKTHAANPDINYQCFFITFFAIFE